MIRLLILFPFVFLACRQSVTPSAAEKETSASVIYTAPPLLFPTSHWTRDRAQNVGIDSVILANALASRKYTTFGAAQSHLPAPPSAYSSPKINSHLINP